MVHSLSKCILFLYISIEYVPVDPGEVQKYGIDTALINQLKNNVKSL